MRKLFVSISLVSFGLVAMGLAASLRSVSGFQEVCPDSNDAGTLVQLVRGSETNATSYYCQNASAVPVYFGGSDVSSTTGVAICNPPACTRADLSVDVGLGNLYCTTDQEANDATISCLAGGS